MKNLFPWKSVLILACLFGASGAINAQLDIAGFNSPYGWVATKISTNRDNRAMAVATQWDPSHHDLKIVAAGYTAPKFGEAADFAIVRYNNDGSLDPTFGVGGIVTIDWVGHDDKATGIAIDGLNRIVVGGYAEIDLHIPKVYQFAVARLLYDGTPDPSFGKYPWVVRPGLVVGHAGKGQAMAVDASNQIIITGPVIEGSIGKNVFGTERFTVDGVRDPLFGTAGRVLTDIPGIDAEDDYAQSVVMADATAPQRIVVAGYTKREYADVVAVRYLPNGILDPSFGSGGIAILAHNYEEYGLSVDRQRDGMFVIGGYQRKYYDGTEDFQALRVQNDGALDLTFNPGSPTGPGWHFIDFQNATDMATSVKVCPTSDRIALGGWITPRLHWVLGPPQFGLACLEKSGILATSFGSGGKFSLDVSGPSGGSKAMALAIEPESQKIIMAGYAYYVISYPPGDQYNFVVMRLEGCCAKPTDQPCDVKTSGCVQYELVSITEDPQRHKTYEIRVTNNCPDGLVYTAVEAPKGLVADWPENNMTYTSAEGRNYLVRNPNFSPFYSVRFSPLDAGIKNGESDVFQIRIPPAADPKYIHVITKVASQSRYEAYLNVFNCPVGQGAPNRPVARTASTPAGAFGLYPNPTGGLLYVDLTDWEAQILQLQVFDAQGKLVQTLQNAAGGRVQSFRLYAHLPNGLYMLSLTAENGDKWTERFVLER